MIKVTYLAVFKPTGNKAYSAYFPDLPGCTSYGVNIENARQNAAEALELHLYGLQNDGDPIPSPSDKPNVEIPVGCFISPVSVFPAYVKEGLYNRAERTSVTIPAWLKKWAVEENINLSQALQATLREMHDAAH